MARQVKPSESRGVWWILRRHFVRSPQAVSSITYKPTSRSPSTNDPTGGLEAESKRRKGLRYAPETEQFILNWKSSPVAGCYTLFVTLNDGQNGWLSFG
jgi:hypothetical protein